MPIGKNEKNNQWPLEQAGREQWHKEQLAETEQPAITREQQPSEESAAQRPPEEQPGGEPAETEEVYLDELNQARASDAPQDIELPPKPRIPFPWLIFIIVLLNDILDILQFTGVGVIATEIIDVFTVVIRLIRWLGKWIGGKPEGLASLVVTYLAEAIPLVGVLPLWSMQIFAAYQTEKKAAEREHQQTVQAIIAEASQ